MKEINQNNYIKGILEKNKKKYSVIASNLSMKNNMIPNKHNCAKFLTNEETLLLQTIFMLRVAFLEELTTTFLFLYSKQNFEKKIIDLEEQGFLITSNTQYGKAIVLSQEALFFFYTRPQSRATDSRVVAQQDVIPNTKKLLTYKILNSILGREVFSSMIRFIETKYYEQDKEFRNRYTKTQYVLNFDFPSGMRRTTISQEQIKEIVSQKILIIDSQELEKTKYRNFVKAYKTMVNDAALIDSYKVLFLKYAFLKDFSKSLFENNNIDYEITRALIMNTTCNYLRKNPYVFWNKLYTISLLANRIKLDFSRNVNEEILKTLIITRRNTLSTKDTEEISCSAIEKLREIDDAIALCNENQENYNDEFEVMIFRGFDANDIPRYDATIVTLDSLRKNQIFVTNLIEMDNEKPIVCFGIIDDSLDSIQTQTLQKRVEMIYHYATKNLLAFDFEIEVYTYKDADVLSLKEKIRFIQQTFREASSSYSLLIEKLNVVSIIASEVHPKERYQIMNSFYEENQKFL